MGGKGEEEERGWGGTKMSSWALTEIVRKQKEEMDKMWERGQANAVFFCCTLPTTMRNKLKQKIFLPSWRGDASISDKKKLERKGPIREIT